MRISEARCIRSCSFVIARHDSKMIIILATFSPQPCRLRIFRGVRLRNLLFLTILSSFRNFLVYFVEKRRGVPVVTFLF